MAAIVCSVPDCTAKKYAQTGKDGTKEQPFIPLRLLVCGHSVCDLCVLQFCQRQTQFIKCSICAFNTTINEAVQRAVVQSEQDIKRWVDSSSVLPPEVIRFDSNVFPLDYHQMGYGMMSGTLSATKTAEMIDLDLDDEPTHGSSLATNSALNNLYGDDNIVKIAVSRVPKTAPKDFQESVENGAKVYVDFTQNHLMAKRRSDETRDWFKKIKSDASKMFHRLHSVLQIRERQLMDEIDTLQEGRQTEIKVIMNEILSKKSELKGKLLQSPQLQNDKDRITLKKAIDRLLKDAATAPIESPDSDFRFRYETAIEIHLKKFGRVEQKSGKASESMDEVMITDNESEKQSETPIDVSSDEEDIAETAKADNTDNKDVVTILRADNPSKFYVQRSSDRETFEILNSEIDNVCHSPYNHAPALETLREGDALFAYSLKKQCWCRATLILFHTDKDRTTGEPSYLADIVLIDYGITETVQWYNIREKKSEIFDYRKWPPLARKCSLYGIKPNRKTSQATHWSQEAIDLFNQYIKNNQLILIDHESVNGIRYVDLIHYDVPNVTYQVPSLIEVLVKNEVATLNSNINYESYSKYKSQPKKYKEPEMPRIMKTTSVLVSHVDSPDLFFVQLQRSYQQLLKLIHDLNVFYTDDNVGLYTYYCPKVNTPCAAIFDGDGQFYRGLIIQKGKVATEWVVLFIDFGNKQTCKFSEMRLLKDDFMQMPMQSIPCGLIHVDPKTGFKWSEEAIKAFRIAISNDKGPQILTMIAYETRNFNQYTEKLLVVLRSFDGEVGVKVNELLVKKHMAISTGQHSKADPKGDYDMYGSMDSLNSVQSSTSQQSVATTRSQVVPMSVSALVVLKSMMERNSLSGADKKNSLIKVKVTFVRNPSEFYVQIDSQNMNKLFEDMTNKLYAKYSSSLNMFDIRNVNFEANEWCAFMTNNRWRRGRVVNRLELVTEGPPQEPQYSVHDVDYGGETDVKVSVMRRLDDSFKSDGPLAAKCALKGIRPTGGDHWSNVSVDEFKEFVHKEFDNDLSILVKEIPESEPLFVLLYSFESVVPGPFDPAKSVYTSANSHLVNKGLAIYERVGDAVDHEVEDDDNEINCETPLKGRGEMPFSLLSNNQSVLENLEQRFGANQGSAPKSGETFQYLPERYPDTPNFYGMPTDVKIHPKEYWIAFRLVTEGSGPQPIDIINNKIIQALQLRGELPELTGYKKGDACTCFFDYDKTWNRAEIAGIDEGKDEMLKVRVRFVDYDNFESVLPEKLSREVFGKEIPRLALSCQLVNIKPISEDARKQIRDLIYTEVLDRKCRFIWENHPNCQPMKVTVEVPDPNAPAGQIAYIPFTNLLEEKQLLAYDRCEDNPLVEQVLDINPTVDQLYGLYPNVFQPERFYEVVMSHFIPPNYGFFQATELRCPVGGDKVINEEHNRFLQMIDVINDEVDTYSSLNDIVEAKHCLAKWPAIDGNWYRGIISDVDNIRRSANVFFVDYGNSDDIAFSDLREIPKKYLKTARIPKAHAFLCQIHNIRPAKNALWSKRKDLTAKINERLDEWSDGENPMFARFMNNKCPLKIDLYYKNDNDPNTPGQHLFQDFVDKGLLEFVDRRDVYRRPEPTTPTMRSFRNVNVKSERK